MLDEAESESKALKKEAILEAKEQDLKLRNEFERESKEKRSELQRAEQRLMQKEDNLDKKEDAPAKALGCAGSSSRKISSDRKTRSKRCRKR